MPFNLDTFNSFAYETLSEVAPQNINAFNEASRGAIRLVDNGYNVGDTDHTTFFKEIAGLTTYRDIDSDADVAAVDLEQGDLTSVKVAGGTPPVKIPPSQFEWIKMDPEAGGITYGEQMGVAVPQQQLNAGIAACVATMLKIGAPTAEGALDGVYKDISAEVGDDAKVSRKVLSQTAALFSDRALSLDTWLLHGVVAHSIFGENLANTDRLFQIGNVAVFEDGFGRRFIMTDSPSLVAGGGDYYSLCVGNGAITIEDNADMTSNVSTLNGGVSIRRTIQSEWSFNVGVKGCAWTATENSPNLAALQNKDNWGQSVTNIKHTSGVLLKSKA